jgi:hypothetical protein
MRVVFIDGVEPALMSSPLYKWNAEFHRENIEIRGEKTGKICGFSLTVAYSAPV